MISEQGKNVHWMYTTIFGPNLDIEHKRDFIRYFGVYKSVIQEMFTLQNDELKKII